MNKTIYIVPFYSVSDGGLTTIRIEANSRKEAESLAKLHPYYGQSAGFAWPIDEREYLALDKWDLQNIHAATERLRHPPKNWTANQILEREG